jgi:hypothetical protein
VKIVTLMSHRVIVHTKEAKKSLSNNQKISVVHHGTLVANP